MPEQVFSVSDFVAVFNQTVSYAYPVVTIEGELANFRVSKNRWVYFDLKDGQSSVKFFGSVYQLGTQLEEGMKLRVSGSPQLHHQFGFSITIRSIQLAGEGTIKKAAKLLEEKLRKEGLFDEQRKRTLPYPPEKIGLIASGESAGYSDFLKVLNARWGNIIVDHYDIQVQGEDAPRQIIEALEFFNAQAEETEVLVITRGGGSADDMQAFSDERVTRAIAASRIPTLVAVGHERDVCLAELAADQRASTPSNAAELLTPDRQHELLALQERQQTLIAGLGSLYVRSKDQLKEIKKQLTENLTHIVGIKQQQLDAQKRILAILNPKAILNRGYSIAYKNGKVLRSSKAATKGDAVKLRLANGELDLEVK